MDPENDNNEKQDDKDLGMLSRSMKTLSKKVKNNFSMIFRKILASLTAPLIMKIVIFLAILGVFTAALSWLVRNIY